MRNQEDNVAAHPQRKGISMSSLQPRAALPFRRGTRLRSLEIRAANGKKSENSGHCIPNGGQNGQKLGGEERASAPPLVRITLALSERRFEKGRLELDQLCFHLPDQPSGNGCRENSWAVK